MKTCLLLFALVVLAACSGMDGDVPPLQGTIRGDNPQAQTLYNAAYAQESAGDARKAVKTYRRLIKKFPADKRVADSRLREAALLNTLGEPVEAFEAYQLFIEHHPGSPAYATAIKQQETIAYAAAQGEIRTNFLGLKSRLERSAIIGMLTKVRDNAPRANSAPRAQFMMGQVNEFKEQPGAAISSYEKLVDDYPRSNIAADAQFRIGEILLKQAREGNQDQANLERAKNAYRDLLLAYGGSPFAAQAKQRIATIGSRDLQSSYNIAEFYRKKGEKDSAAYYYQDVINRAPESDLRNRAAAQLAQLTR